MQPRALLVQWLRLSGPSKKASRRTSDGHWLRLDLAPELAETHALPGPIRMRSRRRLRVRHAAQPSLHRAPGLSPLQLEPWAWPHWLTSVHYPPIRSRDRRDPRTLGHNSGLSRLPD